MEGKADGATTVTAPPHAAAPGPDLESVAFSSSDDDAAPPHAAAPDPDLDSVALSSSDDDAAPSMSDFDPYDYSDIADKFYACEIEEIPSFRYMSASQRKVGTPYRGQEAGPSVTIPSPYDTDETSNIPRPVAGDVDDIIRRLRSGLISWRSGMIQLSESEIRYLCVTARDVFLSQPMLLELEAPVKICGDIHGQYTDLLKLFEYGGFPPEVKYLFLGNYVNMGKNSIDTLCLLLAYKIKYPEFFFLLRGNHESAALTRVYGFYDECKRHFNVRIWKTFVNCFNCFPVAATVDDRIFCVHGGLSPDLSNMDQIRNIPRPIDIPNAGLLCDLLYSDPSMEFQAWESNDNEEGVSYKFGAKVVEDFLTKHDFDIICRGNQVVEDGFQFLFHRQLVSLFSAPNFQGEYDNAAAIMNVDETLVCSFELLKPRAA